MSNAFLRKWTLASLQSDRFFLVAAHPQKDNWKPLFNGKDLTGWKHVGPAA